MVINSQRIVIFACLYLLKHACMTLAFAFILHFINCTYRFTNSYNGQTCTSIRYLLVPECSSSQFGPNCNTSCSEYCLDRECNQSTGHCLACIDAHSGLFCEKINPPESQGLGKCCTNHCFIFMDNCMMM